MIGTGHSDLLFEIAQLDLRRQLLMTGPDSAPESKLEPAMRLWLMGQWWFEWFVFFAARYCFEQPGQTALV